MSSQPVEANVVLTSDNSQYDQAMVQSTQVTNNMGQSVDTLGSKISKLTKTAGKSLIGISAADVALIGGATAAWASYEKQMTRLQAQSAILGRTTTEQNKLMKDYTGTVKALRTEYGVTTTEAANLVTTLTKITNMRQSTGLKDLSKVFVDMSEATGESSSGLADSLTNLQKMMGDPITAKRTREYADQFTYLSAKTQTSAQGLIDFTTQLAPAGKAIGMHSDAITGWATAFTKAGVDGGPAAQVFTKITNDIAHSLATGSPEIAHYANMLGITQKQFRQLGGDEQVLRLFEKLHAEGKGASTEFARLNMDSVRGVRAVRAVLQGGDLRQTMADATSGKGSASAGAAKEAADATDNMSREMGKFHEQVKQLAETLGGEFGPTIEGFVKGMNKALEVVNSIASGPIGQMIGWVMKLVAPFAAGAGAILLFAGALLKLAGVFTVFQNSLVKGGREGWKGGASISGQVNEEGQYMARGGGEMMPYAQKLAGVTSDKPGTWLQRGLYNVGRPIGSVLRGGPSAIAGGVANAYQSTREFIQPSYTRPASYEPRGMGSYIAGGMGRAIDYALSPSFDQMRYPNEPTMREAGKVVGQVAPWTSAKQQLSYATAFGQEKLAKFQTGAIGEERAKIQAAPLLTDAERTAKLANLDIIEKETAARAAAASEAKAAATADIEATKALRMLDAESKSTAVGLQGLKEALIGSGKLGGGPSPSGAQGGLVGQVGGGIWGASKAGIGAFAKSPMAMPVAGMAATAALSATGQDSKMLQYGAMGMMMGPWGAGIGAVTGAILDMTQSNKGLEESLQNLKSVTDDFAKTGVGASDWFDTTKKQQEDLNKTASDRSALSAWFKPGTSLSTTFGSAGNWFSGIVGKSDQEKDQASIDEQRKRGQNVEAVARDLARKAGVEITGTATQQRKKLDDFMSTTGAQRFETAGIDPEQLIAARAKSLTKVSQADLPPTVNAAEVNKANQQAYKAMLDKLQEAKLGPDVESFISKTVAGKAMADSPAAQRSIKHQEDVLAEYQGTQQMFDDLHKQGLTNIQIMHESAKDMSGIKDSNNQQFKLQYDLFQKAQTTEQMNYPMMTRAQQFQSTMGQMAALETVKPTTPEEKALVEQQKMTTAQGVTDQVQYVKQMLLMQDQYEIQRKRAQDDYAQQQTYQLQDFNLQRSRAEQQFNLQRNRATADYYRGVRRQNQEWDIQRKRQEQDFNHQTKIQAEQMAASVYSIYQRVQVERTSSAEWLIANAHDQLLKMQQQEANLQKLRQEGLSNQAIRTLQLNDPAQAQQAASLVAEMTPRMIKQMNAVAGKARVSAAKDLMEDPSNLDNAERMRTYRRSRQQNLEDHNRSMRWSRDDFERQLKQQNADFKLLLHNQDVDFQTSQNRQEKAYKLSMNRSAVDLANAGKEITGSIEGILKQGSTHLTGYAQQTAQAALDTFTGLKKSTRPVAVAIMKDLADIFGFDYQVPKNLSNNADYKVAIPDTRGVAPSQRSTGGHVVGGMHEGGTVPGWSPGRDDHMVPLSGGEAIMRPEWARKVGEKNIEAMNHAAKHGGFAGGGIYRPVNKGTPGGIHDVSTGYAAVDVPVPTGTPVYAVTSGKITQSYDILGNEPRRSPWLGQDGYKSYGRVMYLKTDSGPEVIYAHLSKRGYGSGTMVSGGQAIGASGATGYVMGTTGEHLHFGDSDGNPMEFFDNAGKGVGAIKGAGMAGSGATATMTNRQIVKQVLQARYHAAEKSARGLQGVHPLFPGDISAVINRYALHAMRTLKKKYGAPTVGGQSITAVGGHYGGNAHGVWNALTAAGFSKVQAAGIMGNMQSESGFDPFIVQGGGHSMNPRDAGGGGYGLVQWTPGSKLVPYLHGHGVSVANEINALSEQLAGKGSSPEGAAGSALRNARSVAEAARAFELNYERHAGGPQANRVSQAESIYKQYAAKGAIVNGARHLVVGEAGPEAVIPLDERGADFMHKAMVGTDARRIGMGSSPAGRGISVYNTRIDRSTNFTGAITVQANDPAELLHKLQARQRVMALSRPGLTGSAA